MVNMLPVVRGLALGALHRSAVTVLPIVGAGVLGLCWGQQELRWIALTPLVVLLWWFAGNRWGAFAVGTLYHAVAARSLMAGMSQFFEVSPVVGVAIVLMVTSVLGAAWAVCWTDPNRQVSWIEVGVRVVALLGVAFLPLLGSISLASPLAAAGLLFSGFRWLGLLALVAWWVVALRVPAARWALVLACVARCALFDVWLGTTATAATAVDFESVQMSVHVSRDMFDFETQWQIAQKSIERVRSSRARWVVLPESVGGLWQATMQRAWAPVDRELSEAGRFALVGATLPRDDGDFDNGIVVLGHEHALYRQRMPIPIAMWRPWAEESGEGVFHTHWFGPGVMRVGGRVLGALVCFEGVLPWTVLGSIAQGAEVLLSVSNGQWLTGTGAVQAQRQTLEAWGALFGLAVVMATNE